MNKRGDIPVTILVIGVFAICGLAMISFFVSIDNQKAGFEDIGIVGEVKFEAEKYIFYTNLGMAKTEIKNLLNFKEDSSKKIYFYEEKKDKNKISFSVVYYP